MFGFFKRTKIENWEIELLRNTIVRLPEEFSSLINQIDDELFRGVLINVSDIPDYVAFTFNNEVLKKYDDENGRNFKLTDITVYDDTSSVFLPLEIYISSGTINGYSLGKVKKHKIDTNKIDVSSFQVEFLDVSDYDRIKDIFSEDERKLLVPSEIYSIILDDRELFHIRDLEDGDFIGIDKKKIVYKVTHDPMEIKPINQSLINILSNGSE